MALEQRLRTPLAGITAYIGAAALMIGGYCAGAEPLKATATIADKVHDPAYQTAVDGDAALKRADDYYDQLMAYTCKAGLRLNKKQVEFVKGYVTENSITSTITYDRTPILKVDVVKTDSKKEPFCFRVKSSTGGEMIILPKQFEQLVVALYTKADSETAIVPDNTITARF